MMFGNLVYISAVFFPPLNSFVLFPWIVALTIRKSFLGSQVPAYEYPMGRSHTMESFVDIKKPSCSTSNPLMQWKVCTNLLFDIPCDFVDQALMETSRGLCKISVISCLEWEIVQMRRRLFVLIGILMQVCLIMQQSIELMPIWI